MKPLKKFLVAMLALCVTAGGAVIGFEALKDSHSSELKRHSFYLFHKHEFGEWRVYQAPTCQKTGERVRSCICGEREKETIPTVEHSLHPVADKAPTCTSDGWQDRQMCDYDCGYTVETVLPSGHIYADGLCERCNDYDPDYTATAGLSYKLLENLF